MLKFKGNKKEYRAFMDNLIELYGANATIKEICQMIGALTNANM